MDSGPALQALLLLYDSLNLSGSMLCAISYGIAFTLYCICVVSLHSRLRKPDQRNGALIAFAYTTFAIICATVYLGLIHYFIQASYVYHRDYPGGPIMYQGVVLISQPPYVTSLAFMAVLDWSTLGIQIWRLWIIWRNTSYFLYVVALPVLLFFACIGVGIVTTVDQAHPGFISAQFSYLIGFGFFGLPPAMTILITTLMISRILLIRRRHIRIMGESEMTGQYTGIMSMLIESYALDAVWSMGTIVAYAIQTPIVSVIFLESSVNVKIIALYLIVYRLAKGRAWDTRTEGQLSDTRYSSD